MHLAGLRARFYIPLSKSIDAMILRPLVSSLLAAFVLAGCSSVPTAPDAIEINLVALNDFHGNLEPSRFSFTPPGAVTPVTMQAGGAAAMSGALAEWRREDPNLLFVAAGDLVGASPALSSMWADEPAIEAMNMLGLYASSLGNHEFDQGSAELLRQQHGGCASPRPDKACQLAPAFDGAKFQYLGANVLVTKTGQTLMPSTAIATVKGVKVGLIGAVLQDTASVTTAAAIAGLTFQDEADAINRTIPALRAAGATVFVVLIHEGGHTKEPFHQIDCSELKGPIVGITKKLDPAIRVIVSGHSHTGYQCKVDGRLVTQADMGGHLLTRIKMRVDPVTRALADVTVKNEVINPDVYPAEPKMTAYLDTVRARSAAVLAKPVAKLGAATISRKGNEAGESQLGDLITDAIVAATAGQGVQVGFMNNGGIRKDLESGPGMVATFGHAQAVLPFGNTLVAMDLTGAQLKTLLEQQWKSDAGNGSLLQVSSNLRYSWDSTRPAGQRVVPGSVKINGVALADDQVVRVVANNFLAEGGDTFTTFGQGTRRVDTKIRDLDALLAYLAKHDKVGAAPAPVRIARVR
jgi:5'-nucleotidase